MCYDPGWISPPAQVQRCKLVGSRSGRKRQRGQAQGEKRLRQDAALRPIVGGTGATGSASAASQLDRWEILEQMAGKSLSALTNICAQSIAFLPPSVPGLRVLIFIEV